MNKNLLILSFKTACLCVALAGGLAGNAQALESLKSQFTAYNEQVLQEKLFVHTDKSFYLAGEICWFKIYNTDAFSNKPLAISKIVYLELLDKNNKPVLQSKVAMKDADGDGSLLLPATLSSGKYLLRAYTSWMKNFDAGYFFQKNITVVNARKPAEGIAFATANKYEVQFFPEGGNMVNGIPSRVAFKVTDQNGKGIGCSGVIVNDKGDTVSQYNTLQFGMGSCWLTPGAGRSYTSVTVLPGGSHYMQALPAAYNEGLVMHLADTLNNQLAVYVQSSATNGNAMVYLFAHTRGLVKTVLGNPLQDGSTLFLVDKSKLGDGISHFTVFNAARQPVCERLFFKRPAQQLAISATTSLPEYEQRKKITIAVQSAGNDGKSIAADMSMAVYRIDSLTRPDDININSYLWLTSDLAGNIENPGYYFNEVSPATDAALDNLLLTQGWRRFRWSDVLQPKKPVFQFAPEYKGHIIKGRVTNISTGHPVSGVECFLSVAGTRTQLRGDISDDSGYVKFEMNRFYGNDEIFVQTSGQKDSIVRVEIVNPYAATVPAAAQVNFSLATGNTNTLQNQYIPVQVQNSYLGSKLKQLALPVFDTLPFYVAPDKTYMLDDYVRFTTMEEILREYVPYVNVRKRDGVFYLPVFDLLRKEFFQVDPMVLLDGIPVFDMNKLMAYDPLKIRRLDVVSRIYYYGNMFFGGIINFITYNGDLPGYELDPRVTVIDYKTLQLQREFYSPVYETQEQYAGRMPDFRSLLYWAPNVVTTKDGKHEASFYSSDVAGNFAVVIQGITADGKAGSKTVFFKVKENNALAAKK